MKFNVLNRKVHSWSAIILAVPLLVIIVTGLLLQLKKELPWVQPPEQRGKSKEPTLPFERVVEICRDIPEVQVASWKDIDRIDVRVSRGLMKVLTNGRWEIQIDFESGKVLQVAYRRSDLIESLHDGSWFHDLAKHWIFLPTAVGLLLLWLTGMSLFWLPIYVRRRKRRAAAARQASVRIKDARQTFAGDSV